MTFAFRGTETAAAWREWRRDNVSVDEGGVTLAVDPVPTFVSPSPALGASPPDVRVVDAAVDECGTRYALTAAGDVYRYVPGEAAPRRLPCTWDGHPIADPRALCVTGRTIYVADGAGGRIHAVSRHGLQTRWIEAEAFDDPTALAAHDGTVSVLDAGRATLSVLGRDGRLHAEATGLAAPRDLAVDDAGRRYVLENRGESGGRVPAVERFPPVDSSPATTAVEPGAFRRSDGTTPDPVCLAVGRENEVVAGVGPSAPRPSLLRYLPDEGQVERVPTFERPCVALLLPVDPGSEPVTDRTGGLYAVDGGSGELAVLEAATRHRRDEESGRYEGRVVGRLDSGEPGTQWHRVTLGLDVAAAGTRVRLYYFATDDDRWRWGGADRTADPETVEGIGPTYGGRLRDAGVDDLGELATLDPGTVAGIVSTEIIDVSPARTGTWLERARELTDAGEADPPEAVEGIGPTYGTRLEQAGVETLSELVALAPEAVASIVSTEVLDVPVEWTAEWVEAARDRLEGSRDVRGADWSALDPDPADALLEAAEGRYLWVSIELAGRKFAAPRVGSFRGYFPRQSYLRHLPAIYRDDAESAAFLERFLSLFESTFVDIEEGIESATRYLDPDGIPAEYLSWLGEWLALGTDETWPAPARRELITRAPALFRRRGTRRGLLELLAIYLGHADLPERAEAADRLVYVLEYGDLECIDADPPRERYEALVPCPQCFLVMVRPVLADEQLRTVERIVETHRPAHAVGRVVELPRRVELGANTLLGVNSVLAEPEFALGEGGLGKDTVLREREPHGLFGLRARLGADTTLS